MLVRVPHGAHQPRASCALQEMPMELHIRDVSKTYSNGVQALKDVTLTIPAGMYGLLGLNGAGKSTLMRILATLQEPDGGSVRLGDIDVLNQKDNVASVHKQVGVRLSFESSAPPS